MILDLFRLEGRVAVITAAGRGIGAAIAKAFAEVGADVVIGARTQEQLDAVAEQVRAAGRKAEVVVGDLRTRDGMSRLVVPGHTRKPRSSWPSPTSTRAGSTDRCSARSIRACGAARSSVSSGTTSAPSRSSFADPGRKDE